MPVLRERSLLPDPPKSLHPSRSGTCPSLHYRLVSSTLFPNLGSAREFMVYRMSALWALIAKSWHSVQHVHNILWRPKRKWRKLRYFAFALRVYPMCKICDDCCCFRNPQTVWKSIQQPQIMWMRTRNHVWSNLRLRRRIPNLRPLKWQVLIIILIPTLISVRKACLWHVFRDERTSTNGILFLTCLRCDK